MERREYVVTEVAGPRTDVAGKLRWAGETLFLTEREAEFELRRGTILTPEEHARRQEAEQEAEPEATQEVRAETVEDASAEA